MHSKRKDLIVLRYAQSPPQVGFFYLNSIGIFLRELRSIVLSVLRINSFGDKEGIN